VRRQIAPACTRPIAVLPTKFPTDFFWSGYRECSFGDKHKSPITVSLWPFSSPADFPGTSFPVASIAIREPSRSSTGSCATFGYDVELLGRDEVDETQLIGLTGVVKVSHCQRICHALAGRFCRCRSLGGTLARQSRRFTGGVMTYSYTQISQYLTCPRRYRHRYIDGWKEEDTRAAMLFGRLRTSFGRLLSP
jgi:hypothetical protein